MKQFVRFALIFGYCATFQAAVFADEHLLGYVRGSETVPAGSWDLYQFITSRNGKGRGHYQSLDSYTEVEYGVTDKFNIQFALEMQSLNTSGLVIDGYLPKDNSFGLRPSGYELEAKYNFLSPAKDDFGLSLLWGFHQTWLDPHSGQNKTTYSFETTLLMQKYFLEGQFVWVGNLGLEATHADRSEVADLPIGFDWPTEPEMEIETKLGTGLSYRFVPNWYIGAEAIYEVEYETEIGRERYSLFSGPSLHYGSEIWWVTLTWFPQIDGGGEKYPDQEKKANLHLIEKTEQETRLKIGFNF
ncbi:MAG: hypothetical protein IPJ71_04995 [Bdellovibrionales bacterium]|nr:hypothetical protein [Bdellovibrionales bacterium]